MRLADEATAKLPEDPMTKQRRTITRREALIGGAAALATGLVGSPRIARAEAKELVVGGAAGMAGYMKEFVFPVIEKKLDVKILFEGTRSLVNLEKMRADRDAPKMSVVLMDDPVMLLGEAEGLIGKLTPATVPNLAKIVPGAVHHDGIWANYQLPWTGIAFNKQKLPDGVPSYAALWDPANKGRVVLPSLQNTEGVWTLIAAAQLETGKPFAEAQYDIDAAFRKIKALKPNLLTIYTNQPQAENLLEQGEAWLIGGQFSSYTLLRTAAGAPVDLAAPKEGVCAMPSGICLVKNAPNQQLAEAFIDAFLGPEIQGILVEKSFVLPTNPAAPVAARLQGPGRALHRRLGIHRQESRGVGRPVGSGDGVTPDLAPPAAAAPGPYLEIAGVSKRFRATQVLAALDLTVQRGELLSLLGPSGCGKTTLLRILAGLITPDTGRIRLGARDLARIPAHKRNVGVVFQSYALFPHLTVADNVAFGLRAKRMATDAVAARVAQVLAMVRLEALAERPIAALSGGQQQRIAVARALAVTPDLILLDEPLSALDRKLREVMQVELRRMLRDLGMTAIFVTHDQDEALVLSDRIAVMNEGRIEQIDVPERIYARPATPFVLDFVGTSARFRGTVAATAGGRMRVDTAAGPIVAPGDLALGAAALVAVRPEKIELGAGARRWLERAGADRRGPGVPGLEAGDLFRLRAGRDRAGGAARRAARAAGARRRRDDPLADRRHAGLQAVVMAQADSAGTRRRESFDPAWLLALPGTLYLMLVFALPLGALLLVSLWGPEGLTLAGYQKFLSDPFNWQVVGNTLELAALTTLWCLLLGYPSAFALVAARGWLQSLLIAALFLPLSLSVIVKAFGWTILLRSDGLVNRALLGLGLIDAPLRLIFTETGLLIGIVNIFLPFMVLPLFATITTIDPRLRDAAATLGASPVYRFLHVTLPLTMPGVIAGAALVFSLAISAYVIPTLLIGDRHQVLSTVIAKSFLFLRDAQRGATTSVVLLVLAVAIVMASSRLAPQLRHR